MNSGKPLYQPPAGFNPMSKPAGPTPAGVPVPYPNLGQMSRPTPYAPAGGMCIDPSQLRPTWQSGAGFSHNVQQPQACGTERAKVANLRKLIESHEAKVAEIEKFKDKQDFVNGAMLVTAVVLETSIGFLDLAAAMFSSINPAASKVAKAGLLAIETAGQTTEAATGQRSWASAAGNIADKTVDTGTSIAMGDKRMSIAGKATLSTAKLKYDATVISFKAAFGADNEQIKKDSFALVKDRSKDLAGITADGLKEGGLKGAGKTIEGLVIVAEMYEAGANYHKALDQRMDDYFSHKEWVDSYVFDEKMRLTRLMGTMKADLKLAIAALEACELAH